MIAINLFLLLFSQQMHRRSALDDSKGSRTLNNPTKDPRTFQPAASTHHQLYEHPRVTPSQGDLPSVEGGLRRLSPDQLEAQRKAARRIREHEIEEETRQRQRAKEEERRHAELEAERKIVHGFQLPVVPCDRLSSAFNRATENASLMSMVSQRDRFAKCYSNSLGFLVVDIGQVSSSAFEQLERLMTALSLSIKYQRTLVISKIPLEIGNPYLVTFSELYDTRLLYDVARSPFCILEESEFFSLERLAPVRRPFSALCVHVYPASGTNSSPPDSLRRDNPTALFTRR